MAKPKWTESEKRLLAACKDELKSVITEWTNTDADSIDIGAIDIEADPLYGQSIYVEPDATDEKGNLIKANFDVPIRMKNRPMVEAAVAEMWFRLLNRKDVEFGEVDTYERVERQAYHLAVDAYFTIYLDSRKRGRPRLDRSLLRRMLEMKTAGKSYRQIAHSFGFDSQKDSNKELVRKRIDAAKQQSS